VFRPTPSSRVVLGPPLAAPFSGVGRGKPGRRGEGGERVEGGSKRRMMREEQREERRVPSA